VNFQAKIQWITPFSEPNPSNFNQLDKAVRYKATFPYTFPDLQATVMQQSLIHSSLMSHEPTSHCNRVIHTVKKFSLMKPKGFVTVFKKACYWTLSWISSHSHNLSNTYFNLTLPLCDLDWTHNWGVSTHTSCLGHGFDSWSKDWLSWLRNSVIFLSPPGKC
jgi:hypothetical protein